MAAGFGLAGTRSDDADGALDRQSVAWTGASRTTDSRAFDSMFAPGGLSVGAKGPFTVIVSTTISGGSADVRVRDGNRILRPGVARFAPGGASTASFVTRGSSGSRCHTLRIEWRSPSEASVSFQGASATVLFNRSPVDSPCA